MEDFEKISDENIVWFYRKELKMIDLGARINSLIPKPIRRRLTHLGILEYGKGLDKASGLVLSRKGKEILDSYRHGETGVP